MQAKTSPIWKTYEFLLIGAVMMVGCGGDDGTMMDPPPTFSDLQTKVFDISCTLSSCHDAVGPTGALNLESDVAYSQLVGVDCDNAAAAAMGLSRVVAGDLEKSFMIIKLRGDFTNMDFADPMPLGTSGLEPDRLKLVEDWILDGAQNN